jgi:hypothetical protein
MRDDAGEQEFGSHGTSPERAVCGPHGYAVFSRPVPEGFTGAKWIAEEARVCAGGTAKRVSREARVPRGPAAANEVSCKAGRVR